MNDLKFTTAGDYITEEKIPYIYESPDKGKTIYQREFGKLERKLVEPRIVPADQEEVVLNTLHP